jgi:hypothetical protein
MLRRTLVAAAALLVVIGLVPPASATTPSVKALGTSSSWGIVWGNQVWSARRISMSASTTGAASTDRFVVQMYSGGTWVSVNTRQVSRSGGYVTVSYYPRWGTRSYRLAMLRSTGTLRAKSSSWKSTGYKTVPILRVTHEAYPQPMEGMPGAGTTLPAVWASVHAVARDTDTATVPQGVCRRYVVGASIDTSDGPDPDGIVTMFATYLKQPNFYVFQEAVAQAASNPQFQIFPRVRSFSPESQASVTFTWSVGGTPSIGGVAPDWTGGFALVGGLALCNRTLR